jgi:hypothetical protein
MKKRLGLLSSLLAVGLALMLPGSTAAASAGKITFHDGYCSGVNTVNGTFSTIKDAGFYGTKMTLSISGQGYHNGAWKTEVNFGTWAKTFATSAKESLSHSVSFKPGHSGKHRLHGSAKSWNGTLVLGYASLNSGTCG